MTRARALQRRRYLFRLEVWVQKARSSKFPVIIKGILSFLSFWTALFTGAWHSLYRLRLRKVIRAELPVISIGNITVGGTGKTSFTEKLAKEIKGKGVVLSRGYLREESNLSCIPRGPQDGDEAFMLKQKLGEDRVVVGKRREQSLVLGKLLGADCYLLDDGMQYRKLFRDIDIAMIDARSPLGEGAFLPRGRLRESPRALARVNYVVIHGAESEKNYLETKQLLRKYTNACFFGTVYNVENAEDLHGEKIGAFCGIGNPSGFFNLLNQTGAEIVHQKILPDHAPLMNPREFLSDCKKCGAERVLCTEKDAVKIDMPTEFVPLRVSMEVVYEADVYKNLIDEIQTLMRSAHKSVTISS